MGPILGLGLENEDRNRIISVALFLFRFRLIDLFFCFVFLAFWMNLLVLSYRPMDLFTRKTRSWGDIAEKRGAAAFFFLFVEGGRLVQTALFSF